MSAFRLVLLAALALGAAACSYNPDYGDGVLRCEPGGICPGNLTCDVDNVCRANPGGGVDAPDDNTDGGADTDSTVDTDPPNTTIVSSPSAISGPDVTFIVDSTELNSSFRCSVDSTVLMPCTSTQMFTALPTGTHVFRAAATDLAGNQDPTPVEYMWMVDPTVLDTTITAGPSGTSGPNVSFSFTATRPGSFECQLSPIEAQFTACSSPKTYSALPQRPAPGYTFQVRARDTAGNIDATPAMQTFLVDATGPTVTISAPTSGTTVGTSFTLMFSSEPGATHTCQLDGLPAVSPCTSPRTFTGLTSAMTHSIRVTGTDSFGNVGTPTMNTFTVDDQGPPVTVSGAPAANATVNTTSANLSFNVPSGEPAPFSFECRFNSTGVFAACSNFITSGLVEGAQTLEVRARDRFNNVGPTTVHGWMIQPLFTTILAVRTMPIANGTRVQINNNLGNVRVTAKTTNRFWIQEAQGLSTSTNRGITVQPTNWPGDTLIVAGRSVNVVGTVSTVNGNLVLTQATYQSSGLLAAYTAKDTNRDSVNLLLEANEGMFVNMSGEASGTAAITCQNFSFCIVSCQRTTPVIDTSDIAPTNVIIGRDHNFLGIVEGNGSGYVYLVTDIQETSDACL